MQKIKCIICGKDINECVCDKKDKNKIEEKVKVEEKVVKKPYSKNVTK